MRTAIAAVFFALLSGCTAHVPSDFCDVAAPIRPSVQDQVTEGTKQQILSHNIYGQRSCGWRP